MGLDANMYGYIMPITIHSIIDIHRNSIDIQGNNTAVSSKDLNTKLQKDCTGTSTQTKRD